MDNARFTRSDFKILPCSLRNARLTQQVAVCLSVWLAAYASRPPREGHTGKFHL